MLALNIAVSVAGAMQIVNTVVYVRSGPGRTGARDPSLAVTGSGGALA